MQLTRVRSPRQLISLVPMIDVMLILLVFFMVTSTYLNLDMIPVVERAEDMATSDAAQSRGTASTLLVRIGADGTAYIRGQRLAPSALSSQLQARLAENPLLSVVLLPSSRASTQALVSTMDALTTAGAARLRLMRLEAAQ
ncbi:biopolymer transporter ExbD [uncultured Tateyamaria sp.]|uniref:ExbD/TolR family protein n=1 Tax=uncultured Tateyamaria sp. TaxID=455651 RepID=UPI002605D013|nr:biopolymer transporter ExbD [uncultured Tateyamaria sp.]